MADSAKRLSTLCSHFTPSPVRTVLFLLAPRSSSTSLQRYSPPDGTPSHSSAPSYPHDDQPVAYGCHLRPTHCRHRSAPFAAQIAQPTLPFLSACRHRLGHEARRVSVVVHRSLLSSLRRRPGAPRGVDVSPPKVVVRAVLSALVLARLPHRPLLHPALPGRVQGVPAVRPGTSRTQPTRASKCCQHLLTRPLVAFAHTAVCVPLSRVQSKLDGEVVKALPPIDERRPGALEVEKPSSSSDSKVSATAARSPPHPT